ncbi:hypothetical protein AK812_SmicGene45462 [Symbiodinium microadriaticum]|uniref:Uncharacterized protein n=1 Tax=Symbiodinium microadriaticum TaxID=2951 RepID=A0A1Q9BW35_SYMMI|nr:hypothetical protein AK812_SmicGene45462 [Symbiodinium microadriaticum]
MKTLLSMKILARHLIPTFGALRLRIHADSLDAVLELLVCDEGHRLKSGEFYTCCQFVHPNMLPASSVFQRVFKHAIDRSRDKNASAEGAAKKQRPSPGAKGKSSSRRECR